MRFILSLLLSLLLLFSCNEKTTTKEKNTLDQNNETKVVDVDYPVRAFSNIQKENDTIIKAFRNCINSNKLSDYRKFWDKSDTLYLRTPYVALYNMVNFDYPTYIPTVVAIQKIEKNKYLFKIALMGHPEDFNSLYVIYNLYVKKDVSGEYVFQSALNESLKNWRVNNIDNITYYYSPTRNLQKDEIEAQIAFEDKLVQFLDVEKIRYKFIVCENKFESLKIAGYDYEDSMFLTEQNGGSTYPQQKILFSANNTFTYPHEVTHIYIKKFFQNIHPVIDEGFATYMGGSMNLDYKAQIRSLHYFVQNQKISINEYLFDENKRRTLIDNKSTIMYSAGALLCDLAFEKGGRQMLFTLMNSGGSDEELKKTIEEVFQIKIKDFDSFIKGELTKYEFK